jgi:phosphoglycerol transferase MdoB-like AlkP superfamily enzyme
MTRVRVTTSSLFPGPYVFAQGLVLAAVTFMACWNAYVCLRRRPDARTVLINLSFWLVPILTLVALTGRPLRSFALGTAITFVLQRLHWLKWKYLAATWTAADFRMLFDPANWVIVRQYRFLLAFVTACVVLLLLSWFLVPQGTPLGWRVRFLAGLGALVLIAADVRWRVAHVFDPFGFNIYGHFANLLFSASTLRYEPPRVEGDSALFRSRAARLNASNGTSDVRHADLVVWLQESTMDLRLFDIAGADLPVLRMHQADDTTREAGGLRVHCWGGSTWLTEFAVLTGLSHDDFGAAGNGVFYTVTPNLRFSLPKTLRQSGYETVVLTGAPKAFYNAGRAYYDLGFEDVLNPLDFPAWGNRSVERELIGDAELGRYALDILRRPRTRPLFLFVLSVMQHGPYDPRYPIAHGLGQSRLDHRTAACLSHYVSQMEATSDALMKFSQQLLGSPRPTVLAYFGDHQPNLGGRIEYLPEVSNARYLTSYSIKTNFEPKPIESSSSVLDVSYLAAVLLEFAGVRANEFFAANRAMRLLCRGRLADCADNELLRSYKAYLFHDLRAVQREP